MTPAPGHADALALLRREFPEPWKIEVEPLMDADPGGEQLADVWNDNLWLQGRADDPLAAAQALIAAWREATKPLTDGRTYFDASAESAAKWRECADALAKTLKAIQWREAVLYESGLEACVYMCVDALHAVERSLARYDALRKEFLDA